MYFLQDKRFQLATISKIYLSEFDFYGASSIFRKVRCDLFVFFILVLKKWEQEREELEKAKTKERYEEGEAEIAPAPVAERAEELFEDNRLADLDDLFSDSDSEADALPPAEIQEGSTFKGGFLVFRQALPPDSGQL